MPSPVCSEQSSPTLGTKLISTSFILSQDQQSSFPKTVEKTLTRKDSIEKATCFFSTNLCDPQVHVTFLPSLLHCLSKVTERTCQCTWTKYLHYLTVIAVLKIQQMWIKGDWKQSATSQFPHIKHTPTQMFFPPARSNYMVIVKITASNSVTVPIRQLVM